MAKVTYLTKNVNTENLVSFIFQFSNGKDYIAKVTYLTKKCKEY